MKLGITTIQKDRAPWIKEWIAFHKLVGFNHFYVFLDNCTDDTEKILINLKKKLKIEIFKTKPKLKNPQLDCYQEAYRRFGNKVDWMAFIDSDEFLFPTVGTSVPKILEDFAKEKISALGVYWSCFGSSGYISEPSGLIIENYKHRATSAYHNNRHIKSLVRGQQGGLVVPADPHFFLTPLGTVDENRQPISSGWTDYRPTYHKLRINHYATQSYLYFFDFKCKNRTPDGGEARGKAFWQEHNRNEVYDHSTDKFVKPLKALMKKL